MTDNERESTGLEVRIPHLGVRWAAAGVVTAMIAGVGYWFLPRDGTDATAYEGSGPVATVEVIRETIAATRTWDGTLGYGTPRTATAVEQGTITRLPEHDTDVERGTELFRVDEEPAIAMVGAIPMYRELGPGSSGADVKQLEENLAELGYDGFTVDRDYTWRTAAAVREWQSDVGAAETGTVGPSDVVFLSEEGTLAATHISVGDTVSPGEPIVDLTGSDPTVSTEVDAIDRSLVEIDAEVTIHLPGGDEVEGTVDSARAIPEEPAGGSGDDAGPDDTMLEVEVVLSEDVDKSLMGASVDVIVDVEEREDVLVVPVNALLALGSGDYGVEIVDDDGTTSVVPVETGLFEGGKVEIEGDRIDEGTVVGVAGR